MKLGSIFALLGLRAPPKRYGSRVEQFDLKDYGGIRFAQWLHPKYAATSFDAAEIDCLRRYVAPGDGVIDVGAHAGDTSVLFAAAVGSTGRVFAVEPNSYVLPVLEENARLNPDIAPITVMPYAAVENDGPLTFDYSDSGFCNGGDLGGIATMKHGHVYRLEVEGRNVLREIERIAPEWLEKIRLIKSDTEGHDADVIRMLAPIIRKHRPYLVCEIYRHMSAEARRAFYAFLTDDLGYRVFRADLWGTLEAEELTPEALVSLKHFDIFCHPA
jgi:FkbM family methyltransferase